MAAELAAGLAPRHLAVLRAVAAGRAELTDSCEPDLYVDGRCCTDHTVAGLLTRAGLIAAAAPATFGGRVPARLTSVGRIVLAQPAAAPAARMAVPGSGSELAA